MTKMLNVPCNHHSDTYHHNLVLSILGYGTLGYVLFYASSFMHHHIWDISWYACPFSVFKTHIFRVVLSSWSMDPFCIMHWLYFWLFFFKIPLSVINIGKLAFFWSYDRSFFSHSFTLCISVLNSTVAIF
jgi:hypothetical protein